MSTTEDRFTVQVGRGPTLWHVTSREWRITFTDRTEVAQGHSRTGAHPVQREAESLMSRSGAYHLEEWPHDLIKVRCDTRGRKGQLRKVTLESPARAKWTYRVAIE